MNCSYTNIAAKASISFVYYSLMECAFSLGSSEMEYLHSLKISLPPNDCYLLRENGVRHPHNQGTKVNLTWKG